MYQITVNYANQDNCFVFEAEQIFDITVEAGIGTDFTVLAFGYVNTEGNPVLEHLIPTHNVLWMRTEYSEDVPGEIH